MSRLAKVVELVLRVALGLIFVVFAVFKLIDPQAFVQDVANFQISPFSGAPWDMWLAYSLPGLEIIAGLCLIFRFLYRGALVVIGGMVLTFIVAIGYVWSIGLNINCGCAGEYDLLGGYVSHITALGVMLAAVVYLAIDELFSGQPVEE
ncbi:DoxX protein [Rubritalea squalenifaciens DSM 18772]|uniref:DoxX protein n=1 Tax=Rubritalea squalenifaciens DSM 18772 TaxID=1123071 RepID=A0A1M6HK77_9BACT|nr:DoxX family protein [Rubritalea squalenifaciens]SHJ22562.1 DoxX protein [Rubritalea squalenifaciens DSM 18772]